VTLRVRPAICHKGRIYLPRWPAEWDQQLCILDLTSKNAGYGGPFVHTVAGSHFLRHADDRYSPGGAWLRHTKTAIAERNGNDGALEESRDTAKRLQPLVIKKVLLAAPPRDNRFGRPLELAKAHWVWPEMVAEITYLRLAGRWAPPAHCFCQAARGQTSERGPAR
jgi:hypothetical protein